jgi:phosphomannomutase
MMAPYMAGHYMSGELNYKVKDIEKVIAAVQEHYHSQGTEDYTDGYSLNTPDWRFNIRASNTEPLLRLNIEARKDGLVDKIKSEIEAIIESQN